MALKNLFRSLVLILALGLSACAASSSSDPTKNLTTYTDTEFVGDFSAVNSNEKDLESVGIKFKTSYETMNGVTTTIYSTDSVVLSEYLKGHAATTHPEMTIGLQKFVDSANAYLTKYQGDFNLKSSDGSLTAFTLKEGVRSSLEMKVKVAQQVIANIKAYEEALTKAK